MHKQMNEPAPGLIFYSIKLTNCCFNENGNAINSRNQWYKQDQGNKFKTKMLQDQGWHFVILDWFCFKTAVSHHNKGYKVTEACIQINKQYDIFISIYATSLLSLTILQ